MNRYGLIGEHLSHSFSPILHKIIFKNSHINGEYNLHEVKSEGLKGKVHALKNLEIKGFNVTIPYKLEIMKYLDDISSEAKMIDAVNTLEYKEGKVIGHNTDYFGFGALLRNMDIDIKDGRAVILGSGGASKSVYHYLNNNGIEEIIFVSRKPENKKDIHRSINIIDYSSLKNLANIDIIINATPLGMYPKIGESPVDKNILTNCKAAVDLIYNPLETEFLKLAKESGLKTSNGLYMLVAQGIKSQEIWNGVVFDDDFYHKVFKGVLEYVK